MNNYSASVNTFDDFISASMEMISTRKKITSPLYQVILAGKANQSLLQNFIIHRYPIKNFWTRNILGIASKIDDYGLRKSLVENIYEEESGAMTNSRRHLETFVDVGLGLGLERDEIVNGPVLPETQAVIDHNVSVCNSHENHFTEGVLSVLLLMEGQPPITNNSSQSMEVVMRDIYQLPPYAYEFFTHHASSSQEEHVSELEDEHAQAAVLILQRYCNPKELRLRALEKLERALELRHQHFQKIYDLYYSPESAPFRWTQKP